MIDRQLDIAHQERCRTVLHEEQIKSLAETDNWAHVDRDWLDPESMTQKELADKIGVREQQI